MIILGNEYPLRYSVLAQSEISEMLRDEENINNLFDEKLSDIERKKNYAKVAIIMNKAYKHYMAFLNHEDTDAIESDLTVEAFLSAEYGEGVVAIKEIIDTIRKGNMATISAVANSKKKQESKSN